MSFLTAQKVPELEFKVEAIIIFVKSIKKDIKWYVYFIGKSVIWTAITLPNWYLELSDDEKHNKIILKLIWALFGLILSL